MKRIIFLMAALGLSVLLLSSQSDICFLSIQPVYGAMQDERDVKKIVDILIVKGTIITMDDERRIISDGAVAVHRDQIEEVGHTSGLQRKYRAKKIIDANFDGVYLDIIDAFEYYE